VYIEAAHSVGELVAEARKSRNMSQVELAARLDKGGGKPISNTFLNDVEKGRAPVPEALLDSVSRELGINRDYLYYLAGRIPPELRTSAPERVVSKAFALLRKAVEGADAE
jgi:transcriptional regulator with XRE-family HTH domain